MAEMPLPMTSWSDFRKPTTSGSKLNELAETGAARHDGPANTGGLPAVRLVTRRRPPSDGIRRTRTGPRMAEVVETFRTKHMEVVAGTADRMADVCARLVAGPGGMAPHDMEPELARLVGGILDGLSAAAVTEAAPDGSRRDTAPDQSPSRTDTRPQGQLRP